MIHYQTKQEKKRFNVGFKAMYKQGRYLFLVLADFRILVFSMSMKMPVAVLDGHTKWITSFSIAGDVAVSSSADKTVCMWDVDKFCSRKGKSGHKLVRDAKTLKQMVSKYEKSADGTMTENNTNTHAGSDNETSFDELTASGVDDEDEETVLEKVSRMNTVVPVLRLTGHEDTVTATSLILGFVVTASADKTIRLWLLDGTCLQVVKNAHDDWITHMLTHNTTIYTTGRDSRLKEWRLGVKKKSGFKGKDTFALKEIRTIKFESRPTKLHVQKGSIFVATAEHVLIQYSKTGLRTFIFANIYIANETVFALLCRLKRTIGTLSLAQALSSLSLCL